MVSLGKHWKPGTYPKIPSTTVNDQERFNMYSWTLSEYQEALKHEKIFTHVMKMFGVNSLVPVDGRDELAGVKYYVAGGSARMMFDFSTGEAETALTDALSCTDDPGSDDAIDLVLPQMWFEPLKWNNGGFDAVFVDYRDVADTDTTAKQAGYRYKLHVRLT
ncbi:hypothetical protein P3T76_009293 [Phytophthora citrophthora]|uniref:Uncharacterized protein n=1 Tax=Phytophthora citrophthora TaxID=4793 RepID=A0AAD9GGT9_9STRA|nr:hypothetical protein P3T76_009293 [Phytophthora citrophthora]